MSKSSTTTTKIVLGYFHFYSASLYVITFQMETLYYIVPLYLFINQDHNAPLKCQNCLVFEYHHVHTEISLFTTEMEKSVVFYSWY